MDKCIINSCIAPQNINSSLKKTFEFIQQNQVSSLGNLQATTLYLKLSLTATQGPLDKTPRQSAANTVTGIITVIEDTYVVLIASGNCPGKYTEYTVEYSKIIEIVCYSLGGNIKALKYELNHLPPLCYEPNNQYIKMLHELEIAINIVKADPTKALKLIFNGVNSRIIYNEIILIRNLLIVEEFFVFPITSITGFIILPVCQDTSFTTDNISINLKAGELNV